MRAYDPTRGGPLVAGAKCVHKYESFQKRIEALAEGLSVGLFFNSPLLRLINVSFRHKRQCVNTLWRLPTSISLSTIP